MSKKLNMMQEPETSTESVQQGPRIGIPVEWARTSKHVHIMGNPGAGKLDCIRDFLRRWMLARSKNEHSESQGQ